MTNEEWTQIYHRKILDHLGAPADVDLSTVTVVAEHSYVDDYVWVDGEEERVDVRLFDITVTWLYFLPQRIGYKEEPVETNPVMYHHQHVLEDQKAAELIISLTT